MSSRRLIRVSTGYRSSGKEHLGPLNPALLPMLGIEWRRRSPRTTLGERRTERRLAAILAADVAGYSRLMGVNEAGTARVLREHRAGSAPSPSEVIE